MSNVIHFESQEARLAYLKGKYEEIIPKKASEKAPAKKKTTAKKKASKKKEVEDEVSAE